MRRRFLWFAMLVLPCVLSGGCAGGNDISPADRLTPAEEDSLISYVRRYIVRAKQLKITDADRKLVWEKRPELHIRYTGHKRGYLSLRWELTASQVLILQHSGELLSRRHADWVIRLIRDRTRGNIPQNFFGAHGEDISLPPE